MQPTTLGREPAVELNGRWEFVTDPEETGVDDGWHEPGAAWPGSRTVTVPHAWQECDDLRSYTGTAWYRRTVEADAPADGERSILRFGAVDHAATVRVNGERVGDHRGGYLPFEVDATDALREGENTVVLRVVDPEDLAEIPHGKQGDPWYTRVSGPWQRVDLVVVPEVRVAEVRATPDLDADAVRLDVAVTGEGSLPDGLAAAIEISHEGEVVATAECDIDADGAGAVTVSLDDPNYWTPDAPDLYDVAVTLRDGSGVVDRYADYFGMRSVAARDGELYLNGDPLRIRGALDQAYYPETHYRPADLDTYREEIETAKELGFNLLRKHIKPAHPRFVELADRLGILVWGEPANPSVYTEASNAAVRDQLRGMIDRDYNRPSVAVWSLYNEEWGVGGAEGEESLWTDGEKQEYVADLYETVREWDPTRPVCDNSGWAHVATDLNDYHEYFVSPDRAGAWDDRLDDLLADPAANYGATVTDPADAPIVVSEFGTWGFPSVARLRDRYGGDPPWFDHDFLGGLKRPAGVDERFEESALSDIFDGLDDLAAAWQRRELDSVAYQIGTMRERGSVAGYVVTEFTDIEWEFNGILDYTRGEKALHDDVAAVNAPVTCRVDPRSHAVRAGETIVADLVVANDTPEPVDARVEWTAAGESGAEPVAVGATDSRRIEDAIAAPAPDVDEVATVDVTASLADRGVTRTATVAVVPASPPTAAGPLHVDDAALGDALADRGHAVVDDPADAAVVITTDPGGAALDVAADGGAALVLPGRDGHVAAVDAFEYRELPERESWNLCASFVAQRLLPGLGAVPGWAFAGLYPYAYVADTRPDDDVSIAYAEGWIANAGAVAVERDHGDGRVAACTLRVTDAYGDHPVATAALDRLLARLD